MSNIAGVKPSSVQPPVAPSRIGGDADGDNDGTKAAAAPAPAAPVVSKPTATLGNYVNTTA
jgi:hypothetical protein